MSARSFINSARKSLAVPGFVAALALIGAACGEGPKSPLSPSTAPAARSQDASVPPILADGNASCASRGYAFEYKIEPIEAGTTTRTVDGIGTVTITVTGDLLHFNWTSTFGVDAVIVKGGPDVNVYAYDPPAESTGDTNLNAPLFEGAPYGLSHISFCYDINLVVTKTAVASYTRDFDWTIAKVATNLPDPFVLGPGQQFVLTYQIAVVKDGGTASDWAVSGTISVTNPHPTLTASGVSVTDQITGGFNPTVTCPKTSLAPGETMTCSYGPQALPNGDARTNTATATSSTEGIGSGTGTAAVAFIEATTRNDNCVTIADTYAGGPQSQQTCASQTFSYNRTVLAADLACGPNDLLNTASLATDDGQTETSDSTVVVTKDCPLTGGCTLTQGYWKTHSTFGPAPYDDTWAQLGETTTFYLSGHSYYQQLQVSASGNAYNILASQFIATKLNILAGADPPAGVNLALIETFFSTYTPAQIGALKGNDPVRQNALSWASLLDTYNNGNSNVNHCSGG